VKGQSAVRTGVISDIDIQSDASEELDESTFFKPLHQSRPEPVRTVDIGYNLFDLCASFGFIAVVDRYGEVYDLTVFFYFENGGIFYNSSCDFHDNKVLVNTLLSFLFPCFPNEIFQKKKREKRKQKKSVRIPNRSAISPEGRPGAVMRMQVRAGTTLAALLTRFELKINLSFFCF